MFFCTNHPEHSSLGTSYWEFLYCPQDLPMHPFKHFHLCLGDIPQWCTIQHANWKLGRASRLWVDECSQTWYQSSREQNKKGERPLLVCKIVLAMVLFAECKIPRWRCSTTSIVSLPSFQRRGGGCLEPKPWLWISLDEGYISTSAHRSGQCPACLVALPGTRRSGPDY